jgi:hypothetical protein
MSTGSAAELAVLRAELEEMSHRLAHLEQQPERQSAQMMFSTASNANAPAELYQQQQQYQARIDDSIASLLDSHEILGKIARSRLGQCSV